MTAIPTESLWRAEDLVSDQSLAIEIDVAELTEAAGAALPLGPAPTAATTSSRPTPIPPTSSASCASDSPPRAVPTTS